MHERLGSGPEKQRSLGCLGGHAWLMFLDKTCMCRYLSSRNYYGESKLILTTVEDIEKAVGIAVKSWWGESVVES